jgi:hypothetical protein
MVGSIVAFLEYGGRDLYAHEAQIFTGSQDSTLFQETVGAASFMIDNLSKRMMYTGFLL